MRNLLVGQSGGPTAVINASLAGVIHKAKLENIKVLGTLNGLEGILNDKIIPLDTLTDYDIKILKQTPSSYLGSCRKKLPENFDDPIYKKIFDVFIKYDIEYFLYIGGNDSMDTVKKLSQYAAKYNIDVKVIGVPKTIDNDLFLTDHTPGYASAAKFIVNTVRQLALDTAVYDMKSVIVLEIMGRNAGWLCASSALANSENFNPVDIICLSEVSFDHEKFLNKLKKVLETKNTTVIAVSEGIKGSDGNYISEGINLKNDENDGFAHANLGGVGKVIEQLITDNLKIKTRSIELSTLQRSFAAVASKTDVSEAFLAGVRATEAAIDEKNAVMVGFKRVSVKPYVIEPVLFDIEQVANYEKKIPADMIAEDGMFVTDKFIDYAAPLIKGEPDIIYKNGLLQVLTRN